ncbi:MAG TPA: hypothetical protein VNN17_06245 [Terriglobia bacterium]|nr:hypothetical protein [Terriglobia bacterium]
MLRRLATLALMIPLSLNGLWMVCSDGATPKAATEGASAAVDAAQCKKMCPLHAPEPETAQPGAAPADRALPVGAICLLTSGGEGSTIAAIYFVVAPPVAAEKLAAAVHQREVVPQLPAARYASPDLPGATPPPEA